MPTIITDGAASAQGYGYAGVKKAANYIEDVFSTYLYTGNGTTQAISNGIDLSGKGGLVWNKQRNGTFLHCLTDTARGVGNSLDSADTAANDYSLTRVSAFNADGFTMGGNSRTNASGSTYVSWTFRKQAKFFDVVTYTGNGVSGRTISHNLGSVPGCIMIKCTDVGYGWVVGHRGAGWTNSAALQSSDPFGPNSTTFNDTAPTASVFTVGSAGGVNQDTLTYVAYLFAHDAGGFGASGSDNVISCGSYTGNNTNLQSINLGYEPQFILIKSASIAATDWNILDNMRGVATGGVDAVLAANSSAAEASPFDRVDFTATGFNLKTSSALYNETGTYIYIAIRRGPMKTPTSGTSVFGLNARTGTGANATVTGGQTDDAVLIKNRGSAVASLFSSRLTGTGYLVTSSTAAEVAAGTTILQANPWDVMDGVKVGTTSTITNASANTFINYLFRRAPGFFDEVCYTGTSAVNTLNHNLGVVPEIWIIKRRTGGSGDWFVGGGLIGSGTNAYLQLNSTVGNVSGFTNLWLTPTSTTFGIGSYAPSDNGINASGSTYVAYLFATCPGVSKVGSYTGSGTTKQIDCGFTGGARFVLIKRTDNTGDWYVWDSARGIVAGDDPYLLLNSTAAEVTGTDYVDTYAAGFEISSTAPAAINANGGSFIFLAIA